MNQLHHYILYLLYAGIALFLLRIALKALGQNDIKYSDRNIHELYKLLYNFIEGRTCITGLCTEMHILFESKRISLTEYQTIQKHFKANRPSSILHPHFYENPYYIKPATRVYWWENPTDVLGRSLTTNQRKQFIAYLINLTSP
jgi:hypothetical protein